MLLNLDPDGGFSLGDIPHGLEAAARSTTNIGFATMAIPITSEFLMYAAAFSEGMSVVQVGYSEGYGPYAVYDDGSSYHHNDNEYIVRANKRLPSGSSMAYFDGSHGGGLPRQTLSNGMKAEINKALQQKAGEVIYRDGEDGGKAIVLNCEDKPRDGNIKHVGVIDDPEPKEGLEALVDLLVKFYRFGFERHFSNTLDTVIDPTQTERGNTSVGPAEYYYNKDGVLLKTKYLNTGTEHLNY